MRLLREEMGDLSAYSGSECSLNIHLSDKGLVERVEMQSQSKLCRVAFNAIWEIAFFPLPADKQDADKHQRCEVIGITTIELTLKSRHHVGFI